MERREKEINGRVYQMLVPAVRKTMPLCTRVAVIVGPVLGTLTKQSKDGGLEAFAATFANVDPDKLDKLFMDAVDAAHLCFNLVPIHTQVEFERHFSAARGDVYLVCCWVLWECVKDFFPQLVAFAPIAQAAMDKARASQPGGSPITG